jgi:hypothetical protein
VGSKKRAACALKAAFEGHSTMDRLQATANVLRQGKSDCNERTMSNCRYSDGNPAKLTSRANVAGLAFCEQTSVLEIL